MKSFFVLILCLLAIPLSARIKEDEPWFSGTILAFYGRNIPPGKIALEPYVYLTRNRGLYNKDSKLIKDRNTHQYQLEFELKAGLFKYVDFEFEVNGYYSHNGRKSAYLPGDTTLRFGFQMLEDKRGTIIPDLRIMLAESFPIGKYDHLSAELKGADATGSGVFETTFIFILRKIYYCKHPFNWTFNFIYTLPTRTDVDGLNIYVSSDDEIKGSVKPGVEYIFDLAFEYKFNRPFGCGIEAYYEHQGSASFTQKRPINVPVLTPSTETLSLAPMLEYDFTADLSLYGGVWFSVLGRNSVAFTSGVIVLFYEF